MLELELKAIVPDVNVLRDTLERAGARLVFAGRLADRRYDTPDGALSSRDQVLRLRVYRGDSETTANLEFKGPTRVEGGYKTRDEVGTSVGDPDTLATIVAQLGYVVVAKIDRKIRQYELAGATIRIERYPMMDDLVEVEGEADAIERAIARTGLPRESFTADRLGDFVRRYEKRTGRGAETCDA